MDNGLGLRGGCGGQARAQSLSEMAPLLVVAGWKRRPDLGTRVRPPLLPPDTPRFQGQARPHSPHSPTRSALNFGVPPVPTLALRWFLPFRPVGRVFFRSFRGAIFIDWASSIFSHKRVQNKWPPRAAPSAFAAHGRHRASSRPWRGGAGALSRSTHTLRSNHSPR